MQEVVVVNKHPFPVNDGYLGMKWTFEPGKKVTIPLPAAVHIFGVGITEPQVLSGIYRRFGKRVDEGEKFIAGFDFTHVELVQQEVVDEADNLKVSLEDTQAKLADANQTIERHVADLDKATSLLKSQEDQIAELHKQIEQLTEK